jgi:integrase
VLAGVHLAFPKAVGQPLASQNLLYRGWPRLLAAAGLPRIRFHDLRHTYATLALQGGVAPKVVQETLGHASVTPTRDTYSHVLPNAQAEAAARIDAVLAG